MVRLRCLAQLWITCTHLPAGAERHHHRGSSRTNSGASGERHTDRRRRWFVSCRYAHRASHLRRHLRYVEQRDRASNNFRILGANQTHAQSGDSGSRTARPFRREYELGQADWRNGRRREPRMVLHKHINESSLVYAGRNDADGRGDCSWPI